MDKIKINTAEEFPTLTAAPVAEAVIDIRSFPSKTLEESVVSVSLEEKLEGYAFLDSHREIHHGVKSEREKLPELSVRDLGWRGIRFQSADSKNIAQFNRDGFVCHKPHQNDSTASEAGR